jgi:hypothetical protein
VGLTEKFGSNSLTSSGQQRRTSVDRMMASTSSVFGL